MSKTAPRAVSECHGSPQRGTFIGPPIRPLAKALTACALTVAACLAAPGTAHASLIAYENGFETLDQQYRWTQERNGDGYTLTFGDPHKAHSGQVYAVMQATHGSVIRSITVQIPRNTIYCASALWIQRPGGGPGTIRLQVVEGNVVHTDTPPARRGGTT